MLKTNFKRDQNIAKVDRKKLNIKGLEKNNTF